MTQTSTKSELIEVSSNPLTFHLHNSQVSYVFGVEDENVLAHHYYGNSVDH